jgi:hypothetical protein
MRLLEKSMLALIAAALITTPTWADDTFRHAGTITSAQPDGSRITLSVLGPWHGPDTQPKPHVINVPNETPVMLFERAKIGEHGWRNGYAQKSLEPSDLRAGDYATVTMQRRDGRLIAEKIEVVRPGPDTKS